MIAADSVSGVDPIRLAQGQVIITLHRAGVLGFVGIALRDAHRVEVKGQTVSFCYGPVRLALDGERERVVVIAAGGAKLMAIFDLNGELLHYSVGPELLDALDLEVVGQPAMN